MAKRLGRYIIHRPRMIRLFRAQRPPSKIQVFVDSDMGGCTVTRKGTSGISVMHGVNEIKHVCRQQDLIGDSSAEDEHYAICAGAKEGLGIQSDIAGFGDKLNLEVLTDSSAARAICLRQGLGRIRHLHIKFLWIQQYVKKGCFRIIKVDGSRNQADLYTKVLDAATLEKHCTAIGLVARTGRAQHALQLQLPLDEISKKAILAFAMISANRLERRVN